MKTLNNYINESLLDDEEDLLNDDSMVIEKFIKDNYRNTIRYTIKKEHNKNIVDVNNSAYIDGLKSTSITDGLFEFGEIKGSFNIYNCPNIENLKGSPKEIGGGMAIRNCKNLKTFNWGPEKVGGSFICADCDKITSLEGAPKEVGGNLNCMGCKNIKSIKGLPEKIKEDIYLPVKNLSQSDIDKIAKINTENVLKFRKYRY